VKILYFCEYNFGGGAKSNLNLALSSSAFAEVAFLGCDPSYPKYKEFSLLSAKARKSISLRYFLDFWDSLNNFNPDIVHATGMYTGFVSLVARSLRKKKFKIIMTLHHTSVRFRFHYFAVRFIPVLNKIDIIHYLTEYQHDLYTKFGLKPKKFKIIPNIVFAHTYTKSEVDDLRNKLLADTSADWLIVSVGRLVESKQIDVFIKIIKKINEQGINAGGIIIGTGEKEFIKKLKDIASELDIASKILFTGFSTSPELYIKAGDFCLFPTLHAEALPLFILESFSQKKTMVVSNHPSIGCIVTDNHDSLVVTDHSAEKYAKQCIALIKNPELLKKLEKGADFTYNEYYSTEKVIRRFEEMYIDTLKD
jgi:glycosyltransferase involved in cell wall biosynthesis